MADGVGFEPTRSFPLPVFKTGPFNHSGTHPLCTINLRIGPVLSISHVSSFGRAVRVPANPERKGVIGLELAQFFAISPGAFGAVAILVPGPAR